LLNLEVKVKSQKSLLNLEVKVKSQKSLHYITE